MTPIEWISLGVALAAFVSLWLVLKPRGAGSPVPPPPPLGWPIHSHAIFDGDVEECTVGRVDGYWHCRVCHRCKQRILYEDRFGPCVPARLFDETEERALLARFEKLEREKPPIDWNSIGVKVDYTGARVRLAEKLGKPVEDITSHENSLAMLKAISALRDGKEDS